MKNIFYLLVLSTLVSCSKLEHTEIKGEVVCVTEVGYHSDKNLNPGVYYSFQHSPEDTIVVYSPENVLTHNVGGYKVVLGDRIQNKIINCDKGYSEFYILDTHRIIRSFWHYKKDY